MLALPSPEAAGLLALAALVLLPGLLVVRAPWTAVPALSVAFWVLSWWWLPVEGRSRLLATAVAAFALLATLRLVPRRPVPPPPGYAGPPAAPRVSGPITGRPPRLRSAPSLLVVAVAVVLVAPFGLWFHAPGAEMAFHTTAARLAVWREALPAGYAPLRALSPFAAHPAALSTLAADVGLLSGLDPGRCVVAATLLSLALVLLGVYALGGTRLRAPAAALGATVGVASVGWPGALAAWGQGAPVLAFGLGLTAAALLLGHASRPSAVAAGFVWGAGALAQPWLTLALSAATALATVTMGQGREGAGATGVEGSPRRGASGSADGDASGAGEGPAARTIEEGATRAPGPGAIPDPPSPPPGDAARRVALAWAVAVFFAAPALVPLARALSPGEALLALGSVRAAEAIDFASGLALLVLAALLASRIATRPLSPAPAAVVAVLAVCAGVLFVLRVHAWLAGGQIPLAGRQALARVARRTSLADAVCAPPGLVDWVPALAGRAVGEPPAPSRDPRPWVPPALREEAAARPPPPCAKALEGSGRPW